MFVLVTTGFTGAGVGISLGTSLGGVASTGRGAGISGAEFRAHSTPVAFCIKSRGSTLYFAMRSWLRPASTHSKNE